MSWKKFVLLGNVPSLCKKTKPGESPVLYLQSSKNYPLGVTVAGALLRCYLLTRRQEQGPR